MRPFYNSLETLLLIVVQEPVYNAYMKSIYCLRLYELAYEANPETRVCFMIKRGIIP